VRRMRRRTGRRAISSQETNSAEHLFDNQYVYCVPFRAKKAFCCNSAAHRAARAAASGGGGPPEADPRKLRPEERSERIYFRI
ncbi:hypothetical protein, partial [uncultured Alistipes sp.]|uniref:hypothetical protein n=1 Tax=uncultured Alistipes sp. TaxID=538949 RepID=UPI00262AE8BA